MSVFRIQQNEWFRMNELTLTTLNPSKSIPLYWKILANSGYLHIEHVADFDGFRISIVFNCLAMLVDGL